LLAYGCSCGVSLGILEELVNVFDVMFAQQMGYHASQTQRFNWRQAVQFGMYLITKRTGADESSPRTTRHCPPLSAIDWGFQFCTMATKRNLCVSLLMLLTCVLSNPVGTRFCLIDSVHETLT